MRSENFMNYIKMDEIRFRFFWSFSTKSHIWNPLIIFNFVSHAILTVAFRRSLFNHPFNFILSKKWQNWLKLNKSIRRHNLILQLDKFAENWRFRLFRRFYLNNYPVAKKKRKHVSIFCLRKKLFQVVKSFHVCCNIADPLLKNE